jgi:hypothetical protein
MIPETPETDDLRELLRQNLAVAKDNNRLLREMRRNAVLGFALKLVVYLLLLGVPLFILSTYLGPIMEAFSGSGGSSLLGAPSAEELQRLMEEYRASQGG